MLRSIMGMNDRLQVPFELIGVFGRVNLVFDHEEVLPDFNDNVDVMQLVMCEHASRGSGSEPQGLAIAPSRSRPSK